MVGGEDTAGEQLGDCAASPCIWNAAWLRWTLPVIFSVRAARGSVDFMLFRGYAFETAVLSYTSGMSFVERS